MEYIRNEQEEGRSGEVGMIGRRAKLERAEKYRERGEERSRRGESRSRFCSLIANLMVVRLG